MKRVLKRCILIVISCVFLSMCSKKETTKPSLSTNKSTTLVNYAKGFVLEEVNSGFLLSIKTPYPEAKAPLRYYFGKGNPPENSIKIPSPIQRFVATSTTHIPMIEALGKEEALVGFPNTRYVSSAKTRSRIDAGLIKEIGQEASLNTELVLSLAPDIIIAFSMQHTNTTLELFERSGIPVVYNGDWLEETPLGRAEWIKVFGVLFDQLEEATAIFTTIEQEYLTAQKLAKTQQHKPTILSGAIMNNDVWYLPSGDSFVAQFLKDANTAYLWAETTGKGSKSLSFETVFSRANTADYWIAPGYYTSKKQMLNSNSHYAQFNAFKNDRIYTIATKTGPTGGVLYYELGPTRPDLILKDLIKITNPELLPTYELTFFELLK